MVLRIFKEDKVKWEKKKKYVKAKVKEIYVEKEFLQASQGATLLCQKDLEKAVSDLTDEAMSNFGVFFECAQEKILFLYPNPDLS